MAPDGYGTGVWQPQGPTADDSPPQGPSGSEPEDPLRDDQAPWHGATPGTGVSNPGTWGWNDSWWQSNDWHQSGRSWTSDQWRDHWGDGQHGWPVPTGWGRRASSGDSMTCRRREGRTDQPTNRQSFENIQMVSIQALTMQKQIVFTGHANQGYAELSKNKFKSASYSQLGTLGGHTNQPKPRHTQHSVGWAAWTV